MKLSFCLHIHQPVGNFDYVIEDAYQTCYKPMLRAFAEIKIGIHISGSLLEWLEKQHPEYIDLISEGVQSGNIELLSSGMYEPILPVFRRDDMIMQIREYSKRLEELCGFVPVGLWLTERVWEPQLASLIAEAGLDYTVVDDTHLLRAGVSPKELFKPWITEDAGCSIRLLGSNMELRYKIPFTPVAEVLDCLHGLYEDGAEMVFYGDDGEKFGVWPGTAKLCYDNGWLDEFISGISSADWLEVVLPSDAASLQALGPVYVPAMSYREMGEWTLDVNAKKNLNRIKVVLEERGRLNQLDSFITGGFWRNFFSLYPEANDQRARVLLAEVLVKRSGSRSAQRHFRRSQCNCAWWHGVFGGIYLPHLRDAVWKELAMAEYESLDLLGEFPRTITADINNDGLFEKLITGKKLSVMIHLEMGLTISEFTIFGNNGTPVPFGHVLSRRTESYHSDVVAAESRRREEGTIHSGPVAEKGLARNIIIDRWRKVSFTDLCVTGDNQFEEWTQSGFGVVYFQDSDIEISNCRNGNFQQSNALINKDIYTIRKTLLVDSLQGIIKVSSKWQAPPGTRVGIEISFNVLSGEGPDRFICVDGEKNPPGWTGENSGREVLFADVWRSAYVKILLDAEYDIWQCPIESVNLSERGFEKVHQGVSVYISGIIDKNGRFDISMTLETDAKDEC